MRMEVAILHGDRSGSGASLLEWAARGGAPDPRDYEAVLTDEHAASSYGLPVVVAGGNVLGPRDLPDDAVIASATCLGPDTRISEFDVRTDVRLGRDRAKRAFLARAAGAGYRTH